MFRNHNKHLIDDVIYETEISQCRYENRIEDANETMPNGTIQTRRRYYVWDTYIHERPLTGLDYLIGITNPNEFNLVVKNYNKEHEIYFTEVYRYIIGDDYAFPQFHDGLPKYV